ncbi:DUF1810 family protein [Aurantimonas aggregata]|uniref:DUF1810 family protein n=1 Tax=Aurantimonas aggregata TaxID=2047720 RepID=A0A6L9ML27_9HYPH|nr:DUF1810 domain-containing protein [Aurantimonas aggregata]NDV88481.1 DUF1810 family protein [Aurantimonas aggregata]
MDAKSNDLARFVDAQDPVIATVLAELAAGRKQSHWMWFVFPQLDGLGRSPTAQFYALASLDEARAYLNHVVLGPRLRRCTETVLGVEGRSANAIFGAPDDMKFHSSMTLFAKAADEDALFRRALDRLFGGRMDAGTLALLGQNEG